MMRKNIKKLLIVFTLILILPLCIDTGRVTLAQFLPPTGLMGPIAPFYGPLPPFPIRTSGFVGRYQGLSPALPLTPPLMSFPSPIVRRPHAVTTLTAPALPTTLKVLLPAGVNTVVLNPFQSPVVAPLTSLTIPVTTTQAQPILLAAGVVTQANPTTLFIFNVLAPTLGTPSLTGILPPSVGALFTIIP
ncbi:MAG: hypothetical protein ACMUJM_14715 [bacterium]